MNKMVETKKKQTMRYSDEELSLLKNTFTNADELLKAIRKVFLQIKRSEAEQQLLANLTPEAIAVIRKTVLPTIDGDAPLNQVIDLWMTLDVKERPITEGLHFILARKKLMDYLDQQLNILAGGSEEPLRFEELVSLGDKSAEQVFTDLLMRNTLIYHIEQQLQQFSVLAEQASENREERRAKIKKDSVK